MFKLQQEIQESLPQLEVLFERYELDSNQLKEINAESQSFKMRVPLVGAFSAGKSSLLNAMLGHKLLSVEIDPASSLATELHYDSTEQIIGHAKEDKTIILSRDDLYAQKFDGLAPDGWVEVRLNNDVLARYPHVCLTDLPGLDSGLKSHTAAIDSYIGRSLAYCLVVSSDEGTLHETTQNFLQELALYKAPVLLVVTKSDKKLVEELVEVVIHLSQQVRDILGNDSKFEIVTTSARKKDFQDFLQALDQLEAQSEQRFRDTVGIQAIQQLTQLDQKLSILSNKDDLNQESLIVKRQELEQEMRHYQESLKSESANVEGQVDGVLNKIISLVESRLTGQMDQLASLVSNHSDISNTVSQTARLAITEGIQQDFAPLVQRYIDRVEDELPDSLNVPNQFTFEKSESIDTSLWIGGATTVVSFILKRFPVVAILMPIVSQIIDSFFSKNNREQQREEKREQARGYVLSHVIPQVVMQARVNLRSHLLAQIQQVKQSLNEDAQTRANAYQATLKQLDEQLQQGVAAFAEAREGYVQDQKTVQQLIATWSQA